MTIQDLIDDLTEALVAYGDIEIAVAYQYNYPLRGYIYNTTVLEADEEDDEDETEPIYWIAIEDDHNNPYATKKAWKE